MLDQVIHLYLGLLDEIDRPHEREPCIAMLCPEERGRAERFVLERHRRSPIAMVASAFSHLAIAELTFSPAEIAALRALSPAERTDRFFDYWALKEAYIKARGMGLRLRLDQFSMLVEPERKIAITFSPGASCKPRRRIGSGSRWPTAVASTEAFPSSLNRGPCLDSARRVRHPLRRNDRKVPVARYRP
jgi:phosphopantetheine--protein transferase-like protein